MGRDELMLTAYELAEGEEAPIGTRRVRADGTFVKTKDGWKPAASVKGPVFAPRSKSKEPEKPNKRSPTYRSQTDLIRGRMAWLDKQAAAKK